jgi:hypothetical protein
LIHSIQGIIIIFNTFPSDNTLVVVMSLPHDLSGRVQINIEPQL